MNKIPPPQIVVIGNTTKSNHRAGNVHDPSGIAPTVMENHGKVICVAIEQKQNE